MIDEISVRNVALIREASFAPSRGLTALTGETGAGKTALLSACKLLMGGRADKAMVREGADGLEVEGRLFLRRAEVGADAEGAEGAGGAPAQADAGSPGAEGVGDVPGAEDVPEREAVVRRRLGADGRSRVSIDGHMASVGELSDLVAPTLDLCGQHEQQTLMRPASHVRMLDAWARAEVEGPREAYVSAWRAAKNAAAELARVLDAAAASTAALDEARFALRRIDEVGLSGQEEYDELAEHLGRAEHSEALATAADTAYRALRGDGGALDSLDAAASALEGASAFDAHLGECAASLREAGWVLEDMARETLSYRDSVEFDAEELALQQERMAAIQGLLRSFGPRVADVLDRRAQAAEMVSLVDDAAAREKAARAEVERAEAALAAAARDLDAARAKAAPRFAAEVTACMARLEMGTSELVCAVEPLPRESWTQGGPSRVEFLFRPGAGMQARPLARIASGGEVSRVMLAVKVVLGAEDEVETLVFDEVDAGVGGATAHALAGVLADLARTHQVIVVTHLAQVAVAADMHYVVRKSTEGEPVTTLEPVSGDARAAEVARMLSGDATSTSLAHAEELLARGRELRA